MSAFGKSKWQTSIYVNDAKPHYAHAYSDNKQQHSQYYTFWLYWNAIPFSIVHFHYTSRWRILNLCTITALLFRNHHSSHWIVFGLLFCLDMQIKIEAKLIIYVIRQKSDIFFLCRYKQHHKGDISFYSQPLNILNQTKRDVCKFCIYFGIFVGFVILWV